MNNLDKKTCKPCEGGVSPLSQDAAKNLLQQIKNWQLSTDFKSISQRFEFKNFFRTMSFVNAIAHIANCENHHPEIKLSYNYCTVTFTTHAINGLSENDFICAGKIDKLPRS